MRNKYTKEFENKMIKLAPTKTINELVKIANKDYNITKKQLTLYLSKRQIRYKDYNKNKVRLMGENIPIGTEYVKPDGMVLVKVSKSKWQYKQRLIYEKYHKVKLTSDDYVIFLDQDRTNFNIDNLRVVSRRESSILANQKIFSSNPKVTETGIDVARLIIKLKDI